MYELRRMDRCVWSVHSPSPIEHRPGNCLICHVGCRQRNQWLSAVSVLHTQPQRWSSESTQPGVTDLRDPCSLERCQPVAGSWAVLLLGLADEWHRYCSLLPP